MAKYLRQFDAVHKNINKFETKLDNYSPSLPKLSKSEEQSKAEKFAAFARKYVAETPQICTWFYMNKTELEHLFLLSNKRDIKKMISQKIGDEYPKGLCRLLMVELIYSVLQFCKTSRMSLVQTGTLLSIFYLTQHYFSSTFDTTTEKVYHFFKEYILLHSVDCPPDSLQIFSYSESKYIVSFFCILYLRNLPLIKLLTLPNFGFKVRYELPPEPIVQTKGKKKR
ncbi:uncharacterized protein LOC116171264 isoform X2 [Photinus pyralis]|nr:uncharacterized protein LOC116171264 isoform X2 [Photinus pyralis]XP_031343859.1 uncharacterized protein LOC116171264 isoform X2 [Photinus pyralis]